MLFISNIAELELRQNKVQQSFTTIEELVNPDLGIPWSVIMLVDHYIRTATFLQAQK